MNQTFRAKKIRILVADREEIFRLGLRELFSLEDDLRVVAQAATSEQTLTMTERFRPHVLLIQGEIAAEPPGNLMEEIRRAAPHTKVVITASALMGDMASRYLESGAAGVISRSAPLSRFIRGVKEALKHKVGVVKTNGPVLVRPEFPQELPLRPADTLTQREKSVIACLMQGFPNREISRRLAIAEQTVKNHLRSIFDKVGVSDRLELVLYAIHQKLDIPVPGSGKEQIEEIAS